MDDEIVEEVQRVHEPLARDIAGFSRGAGPFLLPLPDYVQQFDFKLLPRLAGLVPMLAFRFRVLASRVFEVSR